ncbi:MAG: hypothetical protein ABI837_11215 [Acidobacteriota bacterium]
MNTQRRSSSAGYSLMEITVVLAITVVVLVMVMQMMESAVQASLFVESHNDLSVMAQRPLNFIQTDIVQSRTVFQGNAKGLSFQALMEAGLPLAPSTNLMPVVDPANAFAPDTAGGTRYTGSCILLVRQLPSLTVSIGGSIGSVTVTAGGSGYTSSPAVSFTGGGGSGATATATIAGGKVVSVSITNGGSGYTTVPTVSFAGGAGSGARGTAVLATFNADRYLFEYFYQIDNTARKFSSAAFITSPDHYVDIMRARSEIVADFSQLTVDTTDLTLAQKQKIAAAFTAAGSATCQSLVRDQNDPTGFTNCAIAKAWNANAATTATGFYDFDSDLVMTVEATPTLAIRKVSTLLPELRGGRISGRMDYSIGSKFGVFASPLRHAIPLYYTTTAAPTDAGFEVKITGRPGSQTILTRLVMMSFYGVNKFDSQDGFLITSIPGNVP